MSLRDTRRERFLSPALSQTSRGQRIKRERLGTRLRCIVISINSVPTQMIDGTENPFEVCQRAARYNEFGYDS